MEKLIKISTGHYMTGAYSIVKKETKNITNGTVKSSIYWAVYKEGGLVNTYRSLKEAKEVFCKN